MPGRTFVSYTRDPDLEKAVMVARALREAGARPWRDEEDLHVGMPTKAEVRRTLRDDCDGAVLWLSPAALESPFVMDVELPAIVDRAEQAGFTAMTVFDGLPPKQAVEAVRDRTGLDIGDYNGHVLDARATLAEEIPRLVARYVAARLGGRGTRHDETPIVRIVTRKDTAAGVLESHIDFDWRHAYTPGVPDQRTAQRLRAALYTSIGALLAAFGPSQVRLEARCHLSVAFGLGHALRQPTGAIPSVRVDEELWAPTVAQDAPELIERHREGSHLGAHRIAVEVAISRETSPGVRDWIARERVAYSQHLKFTPPGGVSRQAVPDESTAATWSGQIATRIAQLRDASPAEPVELFLAVPLPMAVFLGWHANAFGSVTAFEWIDGRYAPGWRIP